MVESPKTDCFFTNIPNNISIYSICIPIHNIHIKMSASSFISGSDCYKYSLQVEVPRRNEGSNGGGAEWDYKFGLEQNLKLLGRNSITCIVVELSLKQWKCQASMWKCRVQSD